MKNLIIVITILLTFLLVGCAEKGVNVGDYKKQVQNKFKENEAKIERFSNPNNTSIVEEERLGPGWRYVTYNENLFNNVIIYNHGHRGRKKNYRKFAKSINKGPRDLYEKAKWYHTKGINFYAALRKQTNDLKGVYERSIESIEVFYHLTKII